MECYNGVCDGTGYDGHKMCGCDACVFQRYEGDEVICTNEEVNKKSYELDVR